MSPKQSWKDDESLEWKELKAFILDQAKRFGQRFDVDKVKDHVREKGGNIDHVLDRLAQKGFLAGPGRAVRFPPASPRSTRPPRAQRKPLRPFDKFRVYAESVEQQAGKALQKFRAHFSAYASVNAFLFIVWLVTGAGFPWFLFPMFAWGIGITNHLSAVLQRFKQRREIRALPDLDENQTKMLKRWHKKRTGFASHTATTLSISGLLLMTNLITGGGFPWALIPISALSVSLFLHWNGYASGARRDRKEINKMITEGGGISRSELASDDEESLDMESPVVQEAALVRRKILKQIESMKKEHTPIGEDIHPLLDNYFNQIRQLARKELEINDLVDSIPLTELQSDRLELETKKTAAGNDTLKEEYRKTISAVEKQIRSIEDLERSREVIQLRVQSALNLLKQLQIDLARVKGLSATKTTSYDLLREKSEELSSYLQDLDEGYTEIEEGS